MYLALYRKYRPQSFDEVIGQDHIVKTLVNQIKGGKIGHAYLFCGSRGTGKTSTAKIFARAINCQSPINGSPCGKCEVCKALDGNNIDVLEIDAASNNGVDEIRDLREKIKYPPVNGRYKVYIVDEVHMLSPSAFNALLKTLEEPPSYAVFILATTEVHKLPATILSRCLRFDFRLVKISDLEALLERVFKTEGITAEKEAIEMIARAGEGGVRDTLSIADRCVSYAGDNLSLKSVIEVLGTTEKESLFEIVDTLLKSDLGGSLRELDKVLSEGKSPLVLSKDLISYLRDLLVVEALGDEGKKMVVASEDFYKKIQSQAISQNYGRIISALNALSEVEQELRYSINPRLVLETAIIKTMTQVSLEERLQNIEKRLDGGQVVAAEPRNVQTTATAQPAVSEAAKEVSPANERAESPVTTSASEHELLGKLLTFLRERKDMSLLSCIRQATSLKVENGVALIAMEDKMSIDLASRDKYKPLLSEFFSGFGLSYRFVLAKTGPDMGDVTELRNEFGDKLKIEE